MAAPKSNPLLELLAEKKCLLADGATGTTLFDMGLTSGDAPELWNDEKPENIEKLYQGFIDAGSDVILTNSFGGTRHRLKLHDAQDRVHELNKKAAKIARRMVAKAGRKVIVAGSVGPTGELLVPLGALTYEDAVAAFEEQMKGLVDGGADVLWIETMSSPEEMRAAAEAAGNVGAPYTFTASFDTAGKTMMGMAPAEIHGVTATCSHHHSATGANCGVGASDLLAAILDMTQADPKANVIAKANCGIPVVKGDKVEYTGTPELMAQYVKFAVGAGAKIIGGCCGTTPEHVRAMRVALDEVLASGVDTLPRPTLDEITDKLGPMVNQLASAAPTTAPRERRGRRGRS